MQNKISRVQRSIGKNTSPSQLKSKLHDIENYEKAIMNSKKKQSDIQAKLSQKQSDLARAQTSLAKEQKKEQDRINAMQRSAAERQAAELKNLKISFCHLNILLQTLFRRNMTFLFRTQPRIKKMLHYRWHKN